jgi:tryptophan synthase beta subunit
LGEIGRREAALRGGPVHLLVCLSGRGDKDLATILDRCGLNGEPS